MEIEKSGRREGASRSKECALTIDDIRDQAGEDAVLIGGEGERERYFDAIVGYDVLENRVVYDYNRLAFCFEREGMSFEEACEHIDYNVIRSLPYMGEHAPVVIMPFGVL